MEFEFYAVTDSGLVRNNNEDYFSIPSRHSNSGLAIVADGMGGHKSGEVASKLAVETFVSCFNSEINNTSLTSDILKNALVKANSAVYKLSQKSFSFNNMGTTLTACYLENDRAVFINVGDSRAYIIHNGTAEQITEDHSMVQELLEKDLITKEQALNHPQKNVITRAIGIDSTVQGDVFSRTIFSGDSIVLCTDGLTKHIPIEKLGLLFDCTCTPESIAVTLKDLALVQGGTDNITVIIIRCI